VQVVDGKPQVKSGPYLAEGVGGFCVLEAQTMTMPDRLAELDVRID
jgi:hypothetical protein